MAIKRPDTYEHNNPKLPFVLSKNVKGGALKTADLTTLLSDFVGLEKKLEEGVTKAYVVSENADYRLVNAAAVNMLVSWEKVVTGGAGGASSFGDLEGVPADNEALQSELTRIEDKADGAQADFDYLAGIVDTKLTGTLAINSDVETQVEPPTENNKFISVKTFIHGLNWLKTQAFTLGGLITFSVAPKLNSLTANRILSLDANKNIEDILQKMVAVITNSTIITQLTTESNWSAANVYTGSAIVGAEQLQMYADAKYFYYFYDSTTPIRMSRNSLLHLIGSSGTPSISAGAAAGTTPAISIGGTDLGFRIVLVTGTTPTTGILATVTFNRPYGAAPYVAVSEKNSNAAALAVRPYTATTTTTMTLSINTALAASTQYTWEFIIVQ